MMTSMTCLTEHVQGYRIDANRAQEKAFLGFYLAGGRVHCIVLGKSLGIQKCWIA